LKELSKFYRRGQLFWNSTNSLSFLKTQNSLVVVKILQSVYQRSGIISTFCILQNAIIWSI